MLWSHPDGLTRIVKPGKNYARVEVRRRADPNDDTWLAFGMIGGVPESAILDLLERVDELEARVDELERAHGTGVFS